MSDINYKKALDSFEPFKETKTAVKIDLDRTPSLYVNGIPIQCITEGREVTKKIDIDVDYVWGYLLKEPLGNLKDSYKGAPNSLEIYPVGYLLSQDLLYKEYLNQYFHQGGLLNMMEGNIMIKLALSGFPSDFHCPSQTEINIRFIGNELYIQEEVRIKKLLNRDTFSEVKGNPLIHAKVIHKIVSNNLGRGLVHEIVEARLDVNNPMLKRILDPRSLLDKFIDFLKSFFIEASIDKMDDINRARLK